MPENTTEQQRPVWVRPPSKGRCPHTGLGRSKIYALMKEGRIRSAAVREPGSSRGVRLIHLQSLLDYIEQFATT